MEDVEDAKGSIHIFNSHELKKLKERVKSEGYPSIYAYIKDLVLRDQKN